MLTLAGAMAGLCLAHGCPGTPDAARPDEGAPAGESTQADLGATRSLYAYSTIDALLDGAYDGQLTVGGLLRQGDFGLGTFNHLDGEMLVLHGQAWHFTADGGVTPAAMADEVPLAYVMPFQATERFMLDGPDAPTTLPGIEAAIDARLSDENIFYAVDVTGRFVDMTTRAIAAQQRPYRPLAEVVRQQVYFRRAEVDGTLVGLRSPASSRGVSVPGWHWHFLSADHAYGGHVLGAGIASAAVQVSPAQGLHVELPDPSDVAAVDRARDRTAELQQVEKAQE